MDSSGIYYTIKSKKDSINGKVLFDLESNESMGYPERLRKLRQEVKLMRKRNKIKEFNFILTEGIRLVKVIKFNRQIQLNNDVELVLKEELTKYLQPSESINDYDIKYFKTGKKTQDVFLVALIRRKHIVELCTYAIQDSLNLGKIIIPELAMYGCLKDLNGINIAVLYNEGLYELRTLVCRGSEFLFASQIGTIGKDEVEEEISKLELHIRNQYNIAVNEIKVIGLDSVSEPTIETEDKLEVDAKEEVQDNRYLLLMNM